MLKSLSIILLCCCSQLMADNLTFATTADNYPPYTFIDENGKAQGIYVDIAKRVSELIGKNADVRPLPWRRATNWVRKGTIDSLLITYNIKVNQEKFWILPGSELGTTVYKICTFKEHPFALQKQHVNALPESFLISTVDGYEYAFGDSTTIKHQTKAIARSEPHLIQLLINKRLEAILIEASTYKNHPDKNNIHCFDGAIKGATEHIAFSKASVSKELAQKFAKAMEAFKKTEEFQHLLGKHKLKKL